MPFDRKLVASTGVMGDRFGSGLAVSGNAMVVAAPSATVDGKFFAGAAPSRAGPGVRRVGRAQTPGGTGRRRGSTNSRQQRRGRRRHRRPRRVRRQGRHASSRAPPTSSSVTPAGVDNWGQIAKLTDNSVGSHRQLRDQHRHSRVTCSPSAPAAAGATVRSRFSSATEGVPAPGARLLQFSTGRSGRRLLEGFGGAVALDGDLLLVGAGWPTSAPPARTMARPTSSAATGPIATDGTSSPA